MGLSLAIGMLIDDAIVVRENIVRHLQRGKDHFDGGAGRHGGDRPRRHGHHLHHRGRLRPGGLHGRDGRPVLLRVRDHGGGGGAGLAVRELHPRPHALVALGRSRHRAGPARRPRSGRPCTASTTGSTTCTCATSGCWPGRCATAGRAGARAGRLPRPASPSWPSWAATSCPTSTAASTRSPSSPRRAPRCARPGERAGDGAAAQGAAGRRVHLHHDRRGGHAVPARHRGHDLREAEDANAARPSARCWATRAPVIADVPG